MRKILYIICIENTRKVNLYNFLIILDSKLKKNIEKCKSFVYDGINSNISNRRQRYEQKKDGV